LRLDHKRGINKEEFKTFVQSGKIRNLDWMFDDEQINTGLEAFV